MRRDSHAQWRDLIATRLDRPLARSETRYLNAHLRACDACRQVERDYREQRKMLRALPPRIPPRDLWARTSAALDREVARGAYRGRGLARGLGLNFGSSARRRAPSAALMTTLATLGVAAALAVMQVVPGSQVAPSVIPGKATPFAVNPQPLAFLGNQGADNYLYQVDVAHACPFTEPDCDIAQNFVRTAVHLPATLRARNAVLDPSGHALAFVGRAVDRDVIAVVILPTDQSDGPQTPAPTDNANPPETPVATEGSTPPETPGTQTADPAQTPKATPLPGGTASAPPPSAVPGLRVMAILENVQSAGAPPEWSASGEMLAFSAMPVDGSTGPDVYVWSPNDDRARAITNDHNSYFASWSGERVVLSRVLGTEDGGVAARTFVIDPDTLEERRVPGPRLWLPIVNPAGTRAIAWRGELGVVNGLAAPVTGTLYLVDWARIDPFAPGAEPAPTPGPTDPPTPEPTAQPTVPTVPTAPAATSPASVGPKSETQPAATPTAETTPAVEPTAPGEPTEPAEPDVSPLDVLAELDLGRDPATHPVLDWQARWSSDGHVLGVWIAEAVGDTWGVLTVLAIDLETGAVQTAEPLLPATLARRGFSLGDSRVAWVAPPDAGEGELRIRTWGDDGVGGVRLEPEELQEVVPAF